MRTSTELTPDDSVAKIERVGRYLTLMLNTLVCLFFVGGGYFLARLGWSSDSNWTQLQCALFAAAFFVCAYECRPRRMGADNQRRITFPLGNPNATPWALLRAHCSTPLAAWCSFQLKWKNCRGHWSLVPVLQDASRSGLPVNWFTCSEKSEFKQSGWIRWIPDNTAPAAG